MMSDDSALSLADDEDILEPFQGFDTDDESSGKEAYLNHPSHQRKRRCLLGFVLLAFLALTSAFVGFVVKIEQAFKTSDQGAASFLGLSTAPANKTLLPQAVQTVDPAGLGLSTAPANKTLSRQALQTSGQAPANKSLPTLPSYLGCGCFWHVQQMIVTKIERGLLHRDTMDLTAFAGYAGGAKVGHDGMVCYHNMNMDTDYGELGHGEVVSLAIPQDGFEDIFNVFLDDICTHGVRRDLQDQGSEYRSLVGFPGGVESDVGRAFKRAAEKRGINVEQGTGGDADMLRKIYVMDSTQFPFHQAELYHQFHDDMMERYSQSYHQLRAKLSHAGHLHKTCGER